MTTVLTTPDTGPDQVFKMEHLPTGDSAQLAPRPTGPEDQLDIRSRHRPRRYVWLPLSPLVTYMSRHRSAKDLSVLAEVCPRTVIRWRKEGEIPDLYADRIATELGTHPALIWSMTWWEAAR